MKTYLYARLLLLKTAYNRGKMKKKFIFVILALILWILSFILIYQFTSETGEESNQLSQSVAHAIENVIADHFYVNHNDEFWSETLNLLIRKFAHFIEFAFTGVTSGVFFLLLLRNKWLSVSISFAVCSMMVLVDEYHQKFVAGRSPQLFEVKIDIVGFVFGILVACLIYFPLARIRTLKRRVVELEGGKIS